MRKLDVKDYVEGQKWVCRESGTPVFTEGRVYTVVRRAGDLRLIGNDGQVITGTSSKFVPFEMPNLSEYE